MVQSELPKLRTAQLKMTLSQLPMAHASPVAVAVASQRWADLEANRQQEEVAKQTMSVSVNMASFTFAVGLVSA